MRKFQFAAVVAFGVVFFAGAQLAHAQELSKVQVSFPFVAGDTLLPAGAYEVREDPMDAGLIEIQSEDGRSSAFAFVVPEEATTVRGDCQFEFLKAGNRYYLSKIDNGDGEVEDLVMPAGSLVNTVHEAASKLVSHKW